jgi:hypothetical protein
MYRVEVEGGEDVVRTYVLTCWVGGIPASFVKRRMDITMLFMMLSWM